jgi:hypothetical protein
MAGLKDFLQDIDRRYPDSVDFGYIQYIESDRLRLTDENQQLKYENCELKDELERVRIDRDTLSSLIDIPYITPYDNRFSILPEGKGVVYFIQEEDSLLVKIGYSKVVNSRITQLQTGNPRDLIILGYVEGDRSLEKEFHNTYRKYRVESGGKEWYLNPPLRFHSYI